MLAAKGQRFLLFAYNACNACFGPWNTRANFDSTKAWFSAWLSSSCASLQWFLEDLQVLAHDRGIPVPVGEASVKDFFESLEERTSHGSVFHTSINFLLPCFTLNQQGFLSYLRRYYEEDAGPLEEPVATIVSAAAKAHYSEELRRLKQGCNRIALAAKLLTPWLRQGMMLYMKGTDAHWLAFGTLASLTLNSANHRKCAHNMAMGQWYFVLRELLINVIQTASILRTLGITLGGICDKEYALQEQRDRCSRVFEVALAINGFRADMRFVLVLSDSFGATTRSRAKLQRRLPSSLSDGRSRPRR